MEQNSNIKNISIGLLVGAVILGLAFFITGIGKDRDQISTSTSNQPTVESSIEVETINPTIDLQWFEDTRIKVTALSTEIDSATTVLNATGVPEARVEIAENLKIEKEKCNALVTDYNVNREKMAESATIEVLDAKLCD